MRRKGRLIRSGLSAISAIRRTMAILEELAGASDGLTATELSERTGAPLSGTSRILTTLLQDGYITYEPRSGFYQMGFKTVAMSYRYTDKIGFPEIAMPTLMRLAEKTGELAQLAVVEGEDMWFVAKAEGSQRIKVVSLVGQKVILHAMAAGRVWLAYLPQETAWKLVMRDALHAYTSKTVTSLERLRRELARTRERGYAVNLGEVFKDAVAIGCPVFANQAGEARVVAAVVVTGPAFRLTEDKLHGLAPDVAATAKELEKIWPSNMAFRLSASTAGAALSTVR